MVNDGSPDDSLDLALQLQRKDPRIVVVDLSRNFGHYKAIMTGLSYATGDLVFLIDSDLEEKPEDLALFHRRFAHGDSDVVYGIQQARRGAFAERVGGAIFFALVDALGDRPIPRNLVTARLMTADYVKALVRHRDREFVIVRSLAGDGLSSEHDRVKKLSHSPSTYSLWKRIELAVRHLTTTSTRLLYLVFYAGLSDFRPVRRCHTLLHRKVFHLGHRHRRLYLADRLDLVSGRPHHAHFGDTRNLYRQYHGRDQAAALHRRAPGPPCGHVGGDAECLQVQGSLAAQTPAPSDDRRSSQSANSCPRSLRITLRSSGAWSDAARRRLERRPNRMNGGTGSFSVCWRRPGRLRHRSRLRFRRLPALSSRRGPSRPLHRLRHRAEHDREGEGASWRAARPSMADRRRTGRSRRLRGRQRNIQRQRRRCQTKTGSIMSTKPSIFLRAPAGADLPSMCSACRATRNGGAQTSIMPIPAEMLALLSVAIRTIGRAAAGLRPL